MKRSKTRIMNLALKHERFAGTRDPTYSALHERDTPSEQGLSVPTAYGGDDEFVAGGRG
jgi:hypothetical protein